MPYFEEVNLKVDEENSKYIATITVDEKPLSNTYLGLNPPIRFGFNRVTGWEIGTGFELGRRKELGPLWAWNVGNPRSDQTSNFFGKASYAFGNPHVHYRMGGRANWGKPYVWNLGLTAQIHRLTDAVAPEVFPNYNGNNASIVSTCYWHTRPPKLLSDGKVLRSRCDGHRFCRPTPSH